jgi:hypothetical protein
MSGKRKRSIADRENEERKLKLEWKDYVAISIAALQTSLLPFVLLLLAVVIISILFRVLIFR